MIEVSGLYKSYDGKTNMLKNVSCHVNKGTIHGLIGQNGSGKTTLIKCLTGIYKPDAGVVLLDGEKVFENPEVKARIGYVADYNPFFPGYKAKKIVKFYQGIYEKFSCEEFEAMNQVFQVNLNQKVKNLSKGQQMRLAFMLAMAMKPDILVLDEPTSGLDVIAKRKLFDLLVTKVENCETTVIISSHHLNELENICDDITMICDGAVESTGDLDCLKNRIHKFQVVFPKGAPADFYHMPEILHCSNVGSVYTVLLKEKSETFIQQMNGFGAVLAEEMECGLEEAFYYMNEGGSRNE